MAPSAKITDALGQRILQLRPDHTHREIAAEVGLATSSVGAWLRRHDACVARDVAEHRAKASAERQARRRRALVSAPVTEAEVAVEQVQPAAPEPPLDIVRSEILTTFPHRSLYPEDSEMYVLDQTDLRRGFCTPHQARWLNQHTSGGPRFSRHWPLPDWAWIEEHLVIPTRAERRAQAQQGRLGKMLFF